MNFLPLSLISAHPWQRCAFTSYALSLSFFEAVVLDALVRGGGREPLIMADVEGVRAALREYGARRVGKDYEVEPVAVRAGVFHPKISVLTSSDECHVLVGSGNLTFSGWGGNLEIVEHLHPSFAADAISDAADFFEDLATSDQVRHGAGDRCAALVADLRSAVNGRARNGDVRLLHSLDGAISDKLAQTVEDLGGASRLIVASPFWDSGAAIDNLCKRIGLDHVFIHAHEGGTVEGTAIANWPRATSCAVKAVRVNQIADKSRRLHGKLFEIVCKRGRLLLSGSANATTAALTAGHNVEACVLRIQRDRATGWTFSKTTPPELHEPGEDLPDESTLPGVLRAELKGDEIAGQVITPLMTGAADVFHVTTEGPERLGETTLKADGTFTINTPSLEVQSWKGGRLVIRVQNAAGRAAEGFVSVTAYAEITKRLGSVGARILSVLAGTETPADVAAIMSWFHEDPRRLASAVPTRVSGGGEVTPDAEANPMVLVAELNSSHTVQLASHNGETTAGVSWSRFMSHVFAAFRERRGAFEQTGSGRRVDDEDDVEAGTASGQIDPAVPRSLDIFERLLDLLLSKENETRHAIIAFDLAQYVCERLQPESALARSWLERIVHIVVRVGAPQERREDIAAAILTLLGSEAQSEAERDARSKLIRIGVDVDATPPSSDLASGFQSVLLQTTSFPDMWWARLRSIRTYQEYAKMYVAALESGAPSRAYTELDSVAKREWPTMSQAFISHKARDRVLVLKECVTACPALHDAPSHRRIEQVESPFCCYGRKLLPTRPHMHGNLTDGLTRFG